MVRGDASLFSWSPENQALAVTWDSRRTNSFFLHPLGTTLTAADDFSLNFSLEVSDVTAGVDPVKPYTFQMAVGFVNLAEAFREEFQRGSGVNRIHGPRSTLEWDYFPDTGFGATIAPVVFATNNAVRASFTFPFELAGGAVYDVNLAYTADDRRLRTRMLVDGKQAVEIKEVVLPADSAFDFRLDAFGVLSFSDAGQSKDYAGSILAHGLLRSFEARFPGPLRIEMDASSTNSIRYWARRGWLYQLEHATVIGDWRTVGEPIAGGNEFVLMANNPTPSDTCFYRVKGWLP